MKTDVIALQQTADNLFSPGQDVKHIGRGEVSVVEKGNDEVWPEFSQIRWHHPQIIIMEPNRSASGSLLRHALGKFTIHITKNQPVIFSKSGALPKVMKRWPEGFFREALIKNVNFLLTQRHSGSDQIGVLAFIDLCMCLKVFE